MSTLTITTVQSEIVWCDKNANLIHLTQLLQDVSNTDLILLPETFATGFAINLACGENAADSNVLDWMKKTAKASKAIVAGSVLVNIKNKKANRFYWVWPNGELKFYDKRHLFRLGNEGDHVIAGNERTIFEIKGVRIMPIVCYDLRFPVWSRNRNDYDVLVNVANWPAVRRKVWDTLLQARAIENQTYVIGVNRIGDDGNSVAHNGGTAIYDYLGEPVFTAPNDHESVATTTIDIASLMQFKQKFPAYLDADSFEIYAD